MKLRKVNNMNKCLSNSTIFYYLIEYNNLLVNKSIYFNNYHDQQNIISK